MVRDNNKIKIGLIDSGVENDRKEFSRFDIRHVDIGKVENYDVDELGHGTAIAYLLTRNIKNSILYSMKIYSRQRRTTERDIIDALKYCYENLDLDIIHISSGVITLEAKDEFEDICKLLNEKGTLIVAAFANDGTKSYPASFDDVISVYWSSYCTNIDDYIYVENSPINIMAYSGILRLPSINKTFKNVSGSSFSSAYITGKIAKGICEGVINNREEALKYLKDGAMQIRHFDKKENDILKLNVNNVKKIKHAIIFPVNKEMHSIIGNTDLLSFKIDNVYDVNLMGNVGKNVKDFVYGKAVLDKVIESYTNINWEDSFDTVILGHVTIASNAIEVDILKYFLDMCKKHKKNIYCFDPIYKYEEEVEAIKANGNFVVYTNITSKDVTNNTFGSLNKFSVPIVGVLGTSPKQGKFNIQLELRRRLLRKGYDVGQLGTEPSSLLFGMDAMLASGYNNGLDLTAQEEVYYLNNKLYELNNKDIVLVGTQSQTIPYSFGNINFYTFSQHNLLLASEPDVVVLAININDNLDYIKRTLEYIENYFICKVIGFVLYPYCKSFSFNVLGDNIKVDSNDEIEKYASLVSKAFKRNVYINGKDEDMDLLTDRIIDYFKP